MNKNLIKQKGIKQELETILLHKYDNTNAVYFKSSVRIPELFYGLWQMDEIRIYNYQNGEIAKYHPHLDPYVQARKNILSVTSDGECWIYDFASQKELTIEMPIVAFYHQIEESEEYDDAFVITGIGCPWGFESYEVAFEIHIDENTLEILETTYQYPEDDKDEDDDEEDEDDE